LHAFIDVLTHEVEREESLTQVAFARLLEWLDDGADSGGETYLEMRRRLVAYFDRRNRPAPDALADEAFNRIGRTLEKSGSIATTPPARYCYVVARFVLLEDLRRERMYVPFEEARGVNSFEWHRASGAEAAAASAQERRFECLDCCLRKLKPDQRELIVEYYGAAEGQRIDRRRDLASRLGISMNALAIRVCRIRSALETCVDACGKAGVKGFAGTTPIGMGRHSG
jgi:DNA-directed RNA polymerase specialized sigma24 family protein